MKYMIASATAKDHMAETLLGKSVLRMVRYGMLGESDWEFALKNDKPLPVVYNEFLDKNRGSGRIVILAHDDLLIDDMFLFDKLDRCFTDTQIGVVALAGSRGVSRLDCPMLWHLIGGSRGCCGEMSHFNGGNESADPRNTYITTLYGPPSRVALFDGVFMAIKVDSIPEEVRFDEDCPSKWNFYDLNFSVNCLNAGVVAITYPVKATHSSPGLTSVTDDWKSGEDYFKRKLKDFLDRYGKRREHQNS